MILNIGLAWKSKQGQDRQWYLPEIHDAIQFICGFPPAQLEVLPSDTEDTAVVVLDAFKVSEHQLYRLSQALRQDCIAVLDATGGRLIGPLAAKWGEFNLDKFLHPTVSSTPHAINH